VRTRLRGIWTVYVKEVRSLVRDRHTLVYSVGVPLFLYPVLLVVLLQAMTYTRGVQEQRTVRVALLAATSSAEQGHHDALAAFLDEGPRLEVIRFPPAAPGAKTSTPTADWMATWGVDAALEALFDSTAEGTAETPGAVVPLRARVFFDAAEDASTEAVKRTTALLDDYTKFRLDAAAAALGKEQEFFDVLTIEEEDLATRQEVSNFLAGLLLPLLMILMIATGALYPALDCTVGERERKTLETTLLLPIDGGSVVLGKYLAVVAFALLAFALNFASMGATLAHLQSQLDVEALHLTAATTLVILASAVLLAAFLSAVILLLAFFARTFKEGQTYVMPVYLLAVVTALVTSSPERTLTAAIAWVPLVNLTLLFREALNGRLVGGTVALTLLSSLFYCVVAIVIAGGVVKRQAGAGGGGLLSRRRGKEAPELLDASDRLAATRGVPPNPEKPRWGEKSE